MKKLSVGAEEIRILAVVMDVAAVPFATKLFGINFEGQFQIYKLLP